MSNNISTILKWASIIALISLPILLLTKKDRQRLASENERDENDIFAEELEEAAR